MKVEVEMDGVGAHRTGEGLRGGGLYGLGGLQTGGGAHCDVLDEGGGGHCGVLDGGAGLQNGVDGGGPNWVHGKTAGGSTGTVGGCGAGLGDGLKPLGIEKEAGVAGDLRSWPQFGQCVGSPAVDPLLQAWQNQAMDGRLDMPRWELRRSAESGD